jgi:hypothetical protein
MPITRSPTSQRPSYVTVSASEGALKVACPKKRRMAQMRERRGELLEQEELEGRAQGLRLGIVVAVKRHHPLDGEHRVEHHAALGLHALEGDGAAPRGDGVEEEVEERNLVPAVVEVEAEGDVAEAVGGA